MGNFCARRNALFDKVEARPLLANDPHGVGIKLAEKMMLDETDFILWDTKNPKNLKWWTGIFGDTRILGKFASQPFYSLFTKLNMVLIDKTESSVEIRFPGTLKSYYIAQFFKSEVQRTDVDWLYIIELYSSRVFNIETQRVIGNGDCNNAVFVAMVLAQSFLAEKIKNFEFYKDLEKKTQNFQK